jgi:uncharacterized protein
MGDGAECVFLQTENGAVMISDLKGMLAGLEPTLNAGVWVYVVCDGALPVPLADVVGLVREDEGVTLILAADVAEAAGLPVLFRAAWITLTVHSDLAGVGLTAAFAGALAEAGISCNVVAGAYHDHLFVAEADAGRAMAALRALQVAHA